MSVGKSMKQIVGTLVLAAVCSAGNAEGSVQSGRGGLVRSLSKRLGSNRWSSWRNLLGGASGAADSGGSAVRDSAAPAKPEDAAAEDQSPLHPGDAGAEGLGESQAAATEQSDVHGSEGDDKNEKRENTPLTIVEEESGEGASVGGETTDAVLEHGLIDAMYERIDAMYERATRDSLERAAVNMQSRRRAKADKVAKRAAADLANRANLRAGIKNFFEKKKADEKKANEKKADEKKAAEEKAKREADEKAAEEKRATVTMAFSIGIPLAVVAAALCAFFWCGKSDGSEKQSKLPVHEGDVDSEDESEEEQESEDDAESASSSHEETATTDSETQALSVSESEL